MSHNLDRSMTMNGSTSITLTGPGLAIGKRLDIIVSVSATIEIDAVTAQRKVTAWLVGEVGNLLMGDAPALVIGQRTVWRVPVLLTSPSRGVIGQVGAVDVDATSGQVLADSQVAQEISTHARNLARSTAPSARAGLQEGTQVQAIVSAQGLQVRLAEQPMPSYAIDWPTRRAQLRERAAALGLYEADRLDDEYWQITAPLMEELDHELYT
jgi:hypothetical protein